MLIGMIATVVSFLLPIESKGLDLSETGHQGTKGRRHLVNEAEEDDNKYGALYKNVESEEGLSPTTRVRF